MIVGIVVVLAIVGGAVFSVYYFGFVRPARAELEDAKTSAEHTLDGTLGTVDTSKARAATETYRAKIHEAGSKGEVTSIVEEITSAFKREDKREELLTKVEKAPKGSFYSLDDLSEDLKSKVNSKTSLGQLKDLGDTIDEKATSGWRDLHLEAIGKVPENELVMVREDSPISEAHMSKENALDFVQEKSWKLLRELKFKEAGTFKIPIVDTFERAPSIDEGSTVDVYEYDLENETMTRRGKKVDVLKVIYPKDTLSAISWSSTEDETSHTFSTDVWEEIKASEAGSVAASSSWFDWAKSVVTIARDDANIGDYDLKAIYVLEISEGKVAKSLMRVEQFQTEKKDIVLLARKP